MIVDNLYTYGQSTVSDDFVLSKLMQDLPSDYPALALPDTDPAAAYYMGNIPAAKLQTWTPKHLDISGSGDDTLIWMRGSDAALNWLYLIGKTNTSQKGIYYDNNVGVKKYVCPNARFINAAKVYRLNYFKSFYFRFDLHDFQLSQTLDSGRVMQYKNSNSAEAYKSELLTTEGIYNFFKNDAPITISYNGDDYEIKASTFDRTKRCWEFGNIVIVCTSIDAESQAQTIQYGTTSLKMNPTVGIPTDYGFFIPESGLEFQDSDLSIGYTTDYQNFYLQPWWFPGSSEGWDQKPYNGESCVPGVGEFKMYADEMHWTWQQGNTKICRNSTGMILEWDGTSTWPDPPSGSWQCVHPLTRHDIFDWWELYACIPKACKTAWLASDLYTADCNIGLFTPTNEPKPDREWYTTYPAIDPKLRNWQKYGYDVQDDDYSGSEPAPAPDRPDPTPFPDGENVGDDIYLPNSLGIGGTLGFITQFAMTATQIGELGNLLWTSFLDPDYWKNYLFRFILDTGSFNMSDLLNYFISLRVYPFSMSNIPSLTNYGQDMFIGAGIVPLHYTNDLYTINTLCEYLDAGSLQMPFVFGDFRDCTNMEIILYLPYCGTVQLEPADVLGGKLTARYAIDFGSGACTAYVEIDTWDGKHYLLAALPGQIGSDVPMSASVAGQVAARIGSDVLNLAGTIGSGTADIATSSAALIAGVVTSNPMLAVGGAGKLVGAEASTVGGVAGQLAGMAQRPGIAAPMLSAGRGFSSHGSPRKCYVQIRSPQYQIPDNYKQTAGTPAAKQVTVSSCSGLCRFVNPVIKGVHGTEEEKNKIRQLLQAGIIV